MGPNDKQLRYNTSITVRFRDNLTYSCTLTQFFLNLDAVELDLISSLNLSHVLIPTFLNYFNAFAVEIGLHVMKIYSLNYMDVLMINILLTRSLREPGGPCAKSMEVSESRMERVKYYRYIASKELMHEN